MKLLIKLVFIIFVLQSCTSAKLNHLHNGDLVFVTADSVHLSGAINRVTQQQKNISFEHVGLIEKNKKQIFILHASPKGGSHKEEIHQFIAEEKNKTVVYRLKKKYRKYIPNAIRQANNMLGKPYNFTYVLNDSSYYCSDFIERSFRKNHVFELHSMTFINPATGKTDEFWKRFYEEKNMKVPEGELGSNPNGLAASGKIKKIGILIKNN